jgi:cation transport ATPase
MDAQHILESPAIEKIERFRIRGMHRANCADTIEKAVAPISGLIDAHVNFAAETLTAHVTENLATGEIAAKVAAAGYTAIAETGSVGAGESALDREDARRNLEWVIASAIGAAIVTYLQDGESVGASIATLAVAQCRRTAIARCTWSKSAPKPNLCAGWGASCGVADIPKHCDTMHDAGASAIR